jgi:hypothetical protein
MGTVLVTQVNGVPCFHVKGADEDGKKFQLQSLRVTESVKVPWPQQRPTIWTIRATRPQLAIVWPASECIRYGVLPTGFSEEYPPLKLESWKIYDIGISTTRNGEDDLSSGIFHDGNFCVRTTVNGTLEVHPILWDESAQRWRTEVCDSVAPSK